MKKKVLFVVTGFLLTLLLAWQLLFGFKSVQTSVGGSIKAYRFWGRYTKQVHFAKNGLPDFIAIWPWRHPYHPCTIVDGPCGDPYWIVTIEDRNHDGIWDTWLVRKDLNAPCSIEMIAFLPATASYWSRTVAMADTGQAYKDLQKMRGF